MNASGTSPFSSSTDAGANAEPLSSPDTLFWARVFPCLTPAPILAFGLLTWLRPSAFVPPPPPFMPVFMLGAAALLYVICRASLGQMREVALTGTALLIGPAANPVVVPLDNIAEVKENTLMHVNRRHPVVVEFKTPTGAGSRVMFLPIGNPPFSWKSSERIHPTTIRLQSIIGSR